MKSAACSPCQADPAMLRERERGVALITAVLVVAIAAIIATSMMSRQNFDTRRTANIIHRDQAIAYALGLEQWAAIELAKDARQNNVDHLNEIWAYDLPPLPIDGGFVNGKLEDMQARFNLNSVLDPIQAERLARLCQVINVDPAFIPALQDWIDSDTEVRENGAEDDSYTMLNPPYRAANGFLTDSSELLLVSGVTVQDYNTLAFYISALPVESSINVNTASPLLIQSLTRDVTLPNVERIIEIRANRPYGNLAEFVGDEAFAGKEIKQDHLSVASQYFLLTADVLLDDAPLTLQSVLYRTANGNVTVLNRRFGPPRERVLAQGGGNL